MLYSSERDEVGDEVCCLIQVHMTALQYLNITFMNITTAVSKVRGCKGNLVDILCI